MDSLLKADIFFVVTTIAVCAVSVIAIWVMVHLMKILRNVEDISETVKKETKKFSQDIEGFREHVKRHGALPRLLMRWMGRAGHAYRQAGGTERKRSSASEKTNNG